MAPTRRTKASELGDSWVVNDSGSDASLEDDAPKQELPQRRTSRTKPLNNRNAATPLRSPVKGRRSSRSSSAVPEPELIMPSIHEDGLGASWTGDRSALKANTRSQQRQTKTTRPNGASTMLEESGSANRPRHETARGNSDMFNSALNAAEGIVEWLLDVLVGALKNLKRPISWVVAAYLFAGLMILVQNLLTNSVYSALSPICRIPGSSLLHLPMCQSKSLALRKEDADGPVEFDQLMNVQSRFEEVLEQAAAGVSLPLDMKRGETSIRDLRQIVRFSQLGSRNELVLEFDGFIETARIASYDLQKFNSHVGRGVDNVLSTARWTQRVLDDMANKKSSRGVIPAFINDKLLAPFQPIQLTESKLLDQYIQHSHIVSEEIETLIAEAQALLQILQNLEDRLEVIHGIGYRDNIHIQGSKDEVLSKLWTMLGGNRGTLGKHNRQLELLRHVGEYRKMAWAHVSGTILKLQAMGAELEELRERVGSAEVLRYRVDIPLAVHLESIRLGVERLEQGREAARELERNHLQRVLDKGKEAEGMLLVDG